MMISPFLMTLIAVVTGMIIVMVIVLFWLVRAHLKLKHDYQTLADVVRGHNKDISDLYAAALTTDGYMAATDEQISALYAKISDYQHNEPSTHPYSQVIQNVHSGASVNELMQNSGLSQDEAALLIRLHGSKEQS